jgi:hypothetical protein
MDFQLALKGEIAEETSDYQILKKLSKPCRPIGKFVKIMFEAGGHSC